MKKSSLIAGVSYSALLAALAQSAVAQTNPNDLTIANGTVLTTPQETAKAANNSPGNITIDLGSTLRVTEPGAAVTLNSSNTVNHSGLIEALAPSGGIGVHVIGGFSGNFTAQGSAGAIINVTGSGTGNYGLLLNDPSGAGATFTGNISLTPGSTLLIYGENSTGVAINTKLDGSLVTGTIQGTGVGATGVKTTAEITGSFIHAGARSSVRGASVFTIENVDPLSGPGIAIGATIGGGFLISGPMSPNDGTSAIGAITNSSDAPTVVIAPSVAGANAASITLGKFVTDTAGLDFSFLNRGNITATQNDAGISTTGVRLGETAATSLTVLLENGFYNRGSIQSSSQSDNFFSTNATAVPTNATGLEIGYGTTINAFGQAQTTGLAWRTSVSGDTSTTTSIVLGAEASLVDGAYNNLQIEVGGQTATITNYDVAFDANGVLVSKTATLDNALTAAPAANSQVTIKGAAWPTKAGSGSTTTTVLLGADASDVDGIYEGFTVTIGGEERLVTDYVVVREETLGVVLSKTITLSEALPSAPAADTPLTISAPEGTAVTLGATASGVSSAYNGFTITAGGDTRVVSDYVVVYDPQTGAPTMKVAKIQSATGGDSPLTPPADGSSVSITTSTLFNSGAIGANMSGSKGGVVTAILIHPDAKLQGPAGVGGGSLTNYGAIDASARTSDQNAETLTAIAIDDQSGTLNTIVNHGRISATATPLLNGAEKAIAADLSRGSDDTAQSFFVLSSGDVTGDILFGPAQGNKLIIEGSLIRTLTDGSQIVDNSSVVGRVRATGPDPSLEIEISRLHTGGGFRTANARATSLLVGSNGSVEFALAKNTTTDPIIATTGGVTFEGGTQIALSPTSFLPSSGTYTLLQAGAGSQVQFTDFGATAKLNGSGSPFPFLFEGTYTADGQQLSGATGQLNANALNVTLRRKTATELGLIGNAAAIYEPFAAAALQDDAFGAALLTLDTAAEVQAAVGTTVPDIAGGMRALTMAMTDQATGVIGARQRALLTAPPGSRTELRFWGQEFYNMVSLNSSATHPGYGGAGLGVALGMEWGAIETGRVGLGYTFFSSQEVEREPRDTKTNGDWNMLSAYAAWRVNDFFLAPQVNVGMGSFKSRRTIAVGEVMGRSASANWTSYLAAGGATAGYVIEIGNIDIIPTLAIDVMYFNQGAYNEVGAGGMGLSLRPQRQTSVRSFAGVIGQGTYAFNEGVFMPQLLAGWSHEFADDPATIDGFFESSPGSPFHLVGPTLDSNRIVGGMSFGYVMQNWSIGLNYDASANAGNLQQSATFGITTRF